MVFKEDKILALLLNVPIAMYNLLYIMMIIIIEHNHNRGIFIIVSGYFPSIGILWFCQKRLPKNLKEGREFKLKRFLFQLAGIIVVAFTIMVFSSIYKPIGVTPPLMGALFWILITLSGIFLISTTRFAYYLHQKKLNFVSIEADKVKAELKLLKNQINPHFLFNTLNNIYGLVHLKDVRAPEMISKLSVILRYLVYDCGQQLVHLKKEKELIENYLDIHALKTQSIANRIDFYNDGVNNSHQISPMLLINFVENCFKHSDIEENENGWVKISLEVIDHTLHFNTQNTMKKVLLKSTSGVGLTNTSKMLDSLYPQKHELTQSVQNNVFEVNLELNYK